MRYTVNDQVVLSRPLEGPLAAYIDPFAKWASEQGYAFCSLRRQVLLAACFSRWLGQKDVRVHSVSPKQAVQYLRYRARRVQIHKGDTAALRYLIEFDALLAAPVQYLWSGRRDHAFILVAVQTGLRLSEMTGLKRADLVLGTGAHVRVVGKGRKERCTPIAKSPRTVLKAWLREPQRGYKDVLFPSAKGERLSVHGVQYLLNKHRRTASKICPSLTQKRVTVHRLRHTMAMDLLQGGVDRSVIALWLGHESVETTQIYLAATLAMKEKALAKTTPRRGRRGRYRPGDSLLDFLNSLSERPKLCRVIEPN